MRMRRLNYLKGVHCTLYTVHCTQFIAMMLMIILRFRLQSTEVLNT